MLSNKNKQHLSKVRVSDTSVPFDSLLIKKTVCILFFSAVDQTFDLQPLEVGLDRVPTRLSSSDLDARRQEEEDNLQNLVDEVLNSSSEADFVHGATDQLPSPK